MARGFRSTGNDNSRNPGAAFGNAAPGRKKWSSGSTGFARCALLASTALAGSLALALGCAPNAYALPTVGVVSAGSATITSTPNTLAITQSSQNAAINWQGFSIGQGESVSFAQPNSNSVALNRVLGPDASNILGNLTANGKVFLVNPNGVLFGEGAQVNVGGLVASTLNITDADFMAGQYRFSGADGGKVLNRGQINADGGYVALLGADINSQGLITAKLGSVVLAAGTAVTLDVAGNGMLNVAVNEGAVSALVQNGGVIRANGGQVTMTAQAAGSLLKTAVNNTGVIEAQTIENQNGTITLLADMQSGTVNDTGTLDVSGAGAGQSGGRIVVTGHDVGLAGQAKIDASGDAGGGTILIGGDTQGKNLEVPNATAIEMSDGVTIAADAINNGGGGKVVLWSEGVTQAFGTITSRGGALSGNGGFVETSGQHVTTAAGTRVNTLAPRGKTGLWLLDPAPDYLIGNVAGDDETIASVVASLALSSRTITATRDIILDTALSFGTAQTLTLNAGRDVTIGAALSATTAGSHIVLTAGRTVTVGAAMADSTVGSSIVLTAGTDVNIGAAVTTSAANASIQATAGNNVTVTGAVHADGAGAAIGLTAGNNVVQTAAMSSSGAGAAITMRADNDGTGGPAGGTVILNAPAAIASAAVTIFYSPENGYASPNNYAGSGIISPLITSSMWAFATANVKIYDGTTAATLGFFKGDPTVGGTVGVALSGTATFGDPNVGNAKVVNLAGVSLTGAQAGRYTLFAGTATSSITPAPLTITATNASKIFGQTGTFAPGAFTAAGLVAGESVGSVTEISPGAAASAPVGTYAIAASNAVGGTFNPANYTTTFLTGTLTVNGAPLTVTANSVSKIYGQGLTFAGSAFTSVGLLNGDTIGSVTETSPGAAATAGVVGGSYAITPSNATGGTFIPANYALTYAPGTLTVAPATLTVTANSVSKIYGQGITFPGPAFTSVGLVNGDTIGSVTETSPGAAATASVAGGPYFITASNAAGGTFNAANYTTSYVRGTLTVTPAPLTVTANSASKLYGQTYTLAPGAFTSVGLQNGETIGSATETSAGTPATASVDGGPYTINISNAAGGTFSLANYSPTYVTGLLTVTPAPLVITANSFSKVFPDVLTFTGQEFTSVGLQNGDTIGAVVLTSAGSGGIANVTLLPYAITPSAPSGGTFNPDNYTTTFVAGGLTISAPLFTLDGASRTFGQVNTFTGLGFTPTGLTNSATIGDVAAPVLVQVLRPIMEPGELQLAVIGDGVRMPPYQETRLVPPAPVQQPTPAVQEVPKPVAPVVPVYPRKQDRN